MVTSTAEFFTVAMIVAMSILLTMTMGKAEGKAKAKNRLIAQSVFTLDTLTRYEALNSIYLARNLDF